MRRTIAMAMLFSAILAGVAIGSGSSAAKDPCFFSQAKYNTWKTDHNGSPGWGETVAQVEVIAGCPGLWNGGAGINRCPQANGIEPMTWRVWAQSDGDQVWIAFDDTYPNSPRFHAHCAAGVVRNNQFLSSTYVSQS